MALVSVNVLLGVTASVAAIRVPRLVTALQAKGANVKIIATQRSKHFIESEDTLPVDVAILTEDDEWRTWTTKHDPVLHIELRRWAHVFLIAPLSANTMAKLAHGLCDNLLTCVARAWPISGKDQKPFLVAPAMNTVMWEHPVTASQISTLKSFQISAISPISKTLACGDVGFGAMEEPEKIVDALTAAMK